MRRDASERRKRLIDVAARIFEEEGYDVPLELIAERAGVGRGTLYRNFRDRTALIIEVLSLRLEELICAVEQVPDRQEPFTVFLQRIGLLSALHAPGLLSMEADPTTVEARSKLQNRAGELFELALRRARAMGQIRHDLTVNDLKGLAKMLRSVVVDLPKEDRGPALSRTLTLLMEGIRGSDRSSPR